MKTIMLISFFMMTTEGPMATGTSSKEYADLDSCIYDLVSVQHLNNPQQFALAACVENKE